MKIPKRWKSRPLSPVAEEAPAWRPPVPGVTMAEAVAGMGRLEAELRKSTGWEGFLLSGEALGFRRDRVRDLYRAMVENYPEADAATLRRMVLATLSSGAFQSDSKGETIKISEDTALCLHPRAKREIVPAQTTVCYERRTTAPVRGMIRRVVRSSDAFHRTVCPDCGEWAVSLYGAAVLAPAMIAENDDAISRVRSEEEELT